MDREKTKKERDAASAAEPDLEDLYLYYFREERRA